MKKTIAFAPILAAGAAFAEAPGGGEGLNWSNIASNVDFNDVITAAAPVAIAVVVAVAGVRVFIKLINRGAGK